MESKAYLKNCIDMFSIADHITDDAKIEMFTEKVLLPCLMAYNTMLTADANGWL